MQKRFFTTLSIAFFFCTLHVGLMAQQKPVVYTEFIITIEKKRDGFKMESSAGSTWTSLAFTTPNDVPKAIDEYGMTTLDKVSTEKTSNTADFLFTITKTKKGIVLKGLEGTAWKELVIKSKRGKVTINHLGLVEG